MPKHLLFFVHGMGRQDATWHEAGLKVLRTAFNGYPLLKQNFDFDQTFDPIPVVYDTEFEKLRQQWKDNLAGVKTALGAGLDADDQSQRATVEGKIDDVSKWVTGGGDTFFTTHAMDVILYRFFKTVRMDVNVKVANQFVQRVKGADGNLPGWSVIAHSLGTAVTHNTLHAMYGTTFPGGVTLRIEDTRPRVVMMVANVSRVLQLPALPVLDAVSRVKPGSALSGRCCMYYLNVRHRLDPFTVPKPFNPDAWPDPVLAHSEQYQAIPPSHFLIDQIEEIHDFAHYLRHPMVHGPLFQSVLGKDFLSDEELAKAEQTFGAEAITANTAVIREKLEKFQEKLPADWRAFITILKKWRG